MGGSGVLSNSKYWSMTERYFRKEKKDVAAVIYENIEQKHKLNV